MKWSLSVIVQICCKNRHFSVCLAICYQPTLVAWQLYLLCSAIGLWSFLPRDAMHAVVVYLSVHLSVCACVSVTLRHCVKTAKRRITQIMPHDRPGTLVFTRDVLYRSCRISTDKRVARSLCHSRASCSITHGINIL